MASAISGRSSSPSSPPGPAVATHRLPQVWKVRDLRQGDLQQAETCSNLQGLQTEEDLRDTGVPPALATRRPTLNEDFKDAESKATLAEAEMK